MPTLPHQLYERTEGVSGLGSSDTGPTDYLSHIDSGNGPVSNTTIIGIVVGLTLFIILIASYWIVSRYQKPARQPTSENLRAQETLKRWGESVAGAGKTARLADRSQAQRGSHATRGSTGLSGVSTLVEGNRNGSSYGLQHLTAEPADMEIAVPVQAHTASEPVVVAVTPMGGGEETHRYMR